MCSNIGTAYTIAPRGVITSQQADDAVSPLPGARDPMRHSRGFHLDGHPFLRHGATPPSKNIMPPPPRATKTRNTTSSTPKIGSIATFEQEQCDMASTEAACHLRQKGMTPLDGDLRRSVLGTTIVTSKPFNPPRTRFSLSSAVNAESVDIISLFEMHLRGLNTGIEEHLPVCLGKNVDLCNFAQHCIENFRYVAFI
jgi:hypothetical protein